VSFAIAKTQNALDDGTVPVDKHGRPAVWCDHCGNEGVVILEGTVTIDGQTYSRGAAPCLWCDQGALRYAAWTAPNAIQKGTDHSGGKHTNHHRQLHQVESEYTMFDVLATGVEPRRGDVFRPTPEWCRERLKAGCTQRGLMAIVPRQAWPAEWASEFLAIPKKSGDEAKCGPDRISADRTAIESIAVDAGEVARKRQLAVEAKNEAERMGQ
jgi:hypothetical protein